MTTVDKRRSPKSTRFSGISSYMGSGELGVHGTVGSLDGGDGDCYAITVEYFLGYISGSSMSGYSGRR